jgi:exonuclease III
MVSAALRGAVKSAQIHAAVLGSDHCPVSISLDSSF